MWREYSSSYLKNNRSSGISVMIAAFICALLLSLLCSLFYNMWKYEVERIQQEEGGWQSRIAGEFDAADVELIQNFANIKKVALQEDGAELYFDDMGAVLADTPQIAAALGVSAEDVTYHYGLLAMYLIRDPLDPAPRLIFPLFILIVLLASFSLIMIIHNAFAVSMNGRIHQFGIFSSVGATPRQIRSCLLQEAAALCAAPVLAGDLVGIAASAGILELSNLLARNVEGRHPASFGYHPLVFALTLLVTVITVWISAWLPARKLGRLSPLEAIRNTGEIQLKRKKNSRILAFLFGVEGELAGNALKAQRKALRTASLSLILSFMAFTLMQCFFTLSGISTRETYFERYQDAWDIMVTVKDTDADAFAQTEEIRALDGVESAVVYQKAAAESLITKEELSEEFAANGGFGQAAAGEAQQTEDGWLVSAPVIILDDSSFLAYCEQAGIPPKLSGAIIWNQIRDVTNPDFRHPQYMPYVREERTGSLLYQTGSQGADGEGRTDNLMESPAEIPVLGYTDELPLLREEYASENYYELVHFVPVSLWREIKGQIGGLEEDTYIRILGREGVTLDELNAIQEEIDGLLGQKYVTESENRIQEYETNDEQIRGMMLILGSFCVLLAIIGISNVFANTLGFVRQRRREFARYMSVGMTPAMLRKMFGIEALVIAGRPILLTLPLAALVVWYMLRMSYMEAEVFLAEAPFLPIAAFMLAILGSVALAYYLGWRTIRKISLAEVLQDDTLL